MIASWIGARLWDAVKILVIVLVLKWLVVDLVRIPSASMEPLLHGDPSRFRGDYVAVNKLAYGPRIPFTTQRVISWGDVRRWDVVVFRNPDPGAEESVLIKRVVGLPGEEVLIREGAVLVNGEPLVPPPDLADILYYMRFPAPSHEAVRDMLLAFAQRQTIPYISDPKNADFGILLDDIKELYPKVAERDLSELSEQEREELIAGVRPATLNFIGDWLSLQYRVRSGFEYGVHAQPEFMHIPAGQYYLLGDNSRDSVDSRAFGWVPREYLYGRAYAIVLPPSRIRDLSGFTETWWGPLLLVVIPLLLVLYEFLRAFVVSSARVTALNTAADLRPGDRVLIYRAAYGLRAPLTRRRWRFRRPSPGDMLAYDHEGRTHFGPVADPDAPINSMQQPQFVTIRRDSSFHCVAPGHIDGRVLARVWPWGRRRRFHRRGGASDVPE